jgi:flavoprotein
VVAPCTFNTVGKWAAGISDTLALGLLNQALGAGRQIVAVPNPHVDLAKHPAFGCNVEFLRGCGVQVLFDPERYPAAQRQQRAPRDLPQGRAQGTQSGKCATTWPDLLTTWTATS